jgi:long-chain acyl-CoA synthetase
MNYVCVPLYETLGENAIEFILEHSAVSLVAIQGNKLGRLAKALSQVQRLAGVVYWGEASDKDIKVRASV